MVDNNIMFVQEANWDKIVNNPLRNFDFSDVEDVYVDMNDQIEATIDEAGDGRVMFNANLTAVTEEFDGTEFTVEADYGAYSDSTSFMLSAYKLPVLETTLLVDSVNENMNDTLRFIECSLNGKLFVATIIKLILII